MLDGDVKVVKGLVLAGIGDPRFTPDANAPIDPLPSPSVPAKPPPDADQDARHVRRDADRGGLPVRLTPP